ncbi:hypothetical protein LUZ60_001867 [Juncus effusus]|nr:hypothetical protein LUZ60_001867 [Juncus effusus]
MASNRSSGRYSLRSRGSNLARKRGSVKEGENSAKDEALYTGVESLVPCTRRSQRLQKKLKLENDLETSDFENSSPERSVSDDDDVSSENDAKYDMNMSNGPTCSVCETGVGNNFLISCQNSTCDRSFHKFCLNNPPLNDWTCPLCSELETDAPSRRIQSLVGHRKVDSQIQFLVKWDSLSHHHDSWIPLEWLHIFDRIRLYSYQRKYISSKDGSESIDLRKPEWFQIDHVISCRTKSEPKNPFEISNSILSNPNLSEFEFLVKWSDLDYSESTWESIITDELRGEIAKLVKRHGKGSEGDLGENEGVIGKSWEKEFGRWAEEMNVVVYQGDKESRKCIQAHEFYSFANKPLFDALVTSYELVQLDSSVLKKFNWSCLIIDEAHKIKNLYCKLFSCLKQYKSVFRLLLTGTPLQNTILELFALLHFIDPNEFSDPECEAKSFTGLQHSEMKIAQIHEILKPRMLRRIKSGVLSEKLPIKKWVEIPCALSESQRELYIDILEKNYAKLNKGIENGKKIALNWILVALKKCCNHPYLFEGQEPNNSSFSSLVAASGKLQFLEKLLPKLKERGNRVIIFSQTTKMLDILEDFLSFLNFSYFRIDGQTSLSVRQQNMKEYNSNESDTFIFLMSTRAGGLGIDLPGADRVIIYDPDFNPFADLQAQSRAHRIGQTRPVMVYQLITKSTVEEKILQKSKQKLAIENLVMNPSKTPSIDDLHSVLLHGARKILNREKIEATYVEYDDVAIENLLKLDPVHGELCGLDESDNNGYLGSIESFRSEEWEPSPKKEDWKEVLGEVKEEERDVIEDFGRGKRVKRKVNYVCDEADDDEVYDPESSGSASSDDDDDDDDDGYVAEKIVGGS